LFTHSGIYDDSPLLSLVTSIINTVDKLGRHLIVAADSSDNGEYHVFDSDNVDFKQIPQMIVSSASIPGIFPTQ